MKTPWIETILISLIIIIPASLVIRIIYGAQLLGWEYKYVDSLEVNRSIYDTIKIAVLIIAGFYFGVKSKRKKNREKAGYYELPRE